MIKKIRTKFIIIVMTAVFLVMSAILVVLNAVTFKRFDQETASVLYLLQENNGEIPLLQPPYYDDMSMEMPFRTRYFTVTVRYNNTYAVNITKIASITVEEAINYTEQLLINGETGGFFNEYRYTTTSVREGEMYIFLDCSSEIQSLKFFLRTSIIIGVSAVILVFALVCFFSAILVKPMTESYNKQRRFITDASHEIKTPLTVIGATTEVMEMQYGKTEWTDIIDKQVKKLTDLTEKLVLLSKMDEGGNKINKVEFSITDVALDVANSFENVAKASNKTFNVNIEKDVKYTGDMTLIGQVMSILLENAFKYSNDLGVIEFSVKQMGKNKKIIVTNTTDNIDRKKLNKVFDRFYRIDESRNSETGGSGIGLSIAQAIVTQHNGKISVMADENNKVIFTVVL